MRECARGLIARRRRRRGPDTSAEEAFCEPVFVAGVPGAEPDEDEEQHGAMGSASRRLPRRVAFQVMPGLRVDGLVVRKCRVMLQPPPEPAPTEAVAAYAFHGGAN